MVKDKKNQYLTGEETMPELVALKVKIKLGLKNGKIQHIYPDFNALDPSVRDDMDWALFLDYKGTGWHYDKICGFGETDPYNPDPDVWLGAITVPQPFADAALFMFPNEVEELDESDLQTFYDDRAHVQEPEQNYDVNVLQAIKAKKQLKRTMTQSDADSLDPDKPNPGIVKNWRKKWTDFKAKKGIKIIRSSSSSSSSSSTSSTSSGP